MAKVTKSKSAEKTAASLKGVFPVATGKKSDLLIGDKTNVRGYHTMECREAVLTRPLKCVDRKAWLGVGFYFWLEAIYARYWGEDSKIRKNNPKAKSDSYDVYTADLDIENCINTVFDEEGYSFFNDMIEVAIQYCQSKKIPVTLNMVNRFLEGNVWSKHGIKGIIFDDKPTNPKNKKRIYSEIPDLYYKKRIQVVVFDLKNIRNFVLYLENQK